MKTENLVSKLAEAAEVVERAGVPEDLRPAAFAAAFAALGDDARLTEPAQARTGATVTNESQLALAKRLGVQPAMIADYYGNRDDGTFSVEVPQSKLPNEKAAATRELALLVSAGEQFAKADGTTSLSAIRKVCEDYARLDPSNFAKHLKAADQLWSITGSGESRRLKLRKPGWDEAGGVLRRIAGVA